MAITLPELRARLAARFDEVTLLEILDIRASDIVEAFADRIEEKQDILSKEFDDDEEFEYDHDSR